MPDKSYEKDIEDYKGFRVHGNRLLYGLKSQASYLDNFKQLFSKTEKFSLIPKNIRFVLEEVLKRNLKYLNGNIDEMRIEEIRQRYKRDSIMFKDEEGIDLNFDDLTLFYKFEKVLELHTKLIQEFDEAIPNFSDAENFDVSSLEAKKIINIINKMKPIIHSDKVMETIMLLDIEVMKLPLDKMEATRNSTSPQKEISEASKIKDFINLTKQLNSRFQTCYDIAFDFANEVQMKQALNSVNSKRVNRFASLISAPCKKANFIEVILRKIGEMFSKIVDVFRDIFPSKSISKDVLPKNVEPSTSKNITNVEKDCDIFQSSVKISSEKKPIITRG